MDYRPYIKALPDFRSPGRTFYDIAPLLADGQAWHSAIGALSEKILVFMPDVLVGIEPGGFLLAAPLAQRLACGFVTAHTATPLAGPVSKRDYEGFSTKSQVQIRTDLIKPGQRVVVLNGVMATGRTTRATIDLVRELGANVQGAAFLVELKQAEKRTSLDVPYYALAGV